MCWGLFIHNLSKIFTGPSFEAHMLCYSIIKRMERKLASWKKYDCKMRQA